MVPSPDPLPRDPAALLERARRRDRAALARLLSLVERGGPDARAVGRLTHRLGGSAYTVGITGAPGAGKSTLTSALVGQVRAEDLDVAVLAIDPSSPFTGGAILGDRVRMGDHAVDPHVYIRSMASRGHLGGLSLATLEAIRVLDAAGWPLVVVETVGVGQVEVEVAGAADTTVVVVNPGWGDAVQANKAGILEIADVFAINKADRGSTTDTRRWLESMLEMAPDTNWEPPIVDTVATEGTGIDELADAIDRHRRHLITTDEGRRRRDRRVRGYVEAAVAEGMRRRMSGPDLDGVLAAVSSGALDPWTAADQLLGS